MKTQLVIIGLQPNGPECGGHMIVDDDNADYVCGALNFDQGFGESEGWKIVSGPFQDLPSAVEAYEGLNAKLNRP